MAESIDFRKLCAEQKDEIAALKVDLSASRNLVFGLGQKIDADRKNFERVDAARSRWKGVVVYALILVFGAPTLSWLLVSKKPQTVVASNDPAVPQSTPISDDNGVKEQAPQAEQPAENHPAFPEITVSNANRLPWVVPVYYTYDCNGVTADGFSKAVECNASLSGVVVKLSGKVCVVTEKLAGPNGEKPKFICAFTDRWVVMKLAAESDELAILEFDEKDFKFESDTAPLGDGSGVIAGEKAVAAGFNFPKDDAHPQGDGSRCNRVFSVGIVVESARELEDAKSPVIVHNAMLDYGCAGGPLFNDKQEVIGLNSLILPGAIPLYAAIPVSEKMLTDLLESGGAFDDERAKKASVKEVAPVGDLERYEGFRIERAWDDLKVIKVEGAYMHLDDYCYEKCKGYSCLPEYNVWSYYSQARCALSDRPGGVVELAKKCDQAGDRGREDRQLRLIECWDEWQVVHLEGWYGIILHLTPELYEQVKQRKGADLTWLIELEKAQRIKELNEKYGEK